MEELNKTMSVSAKAVVLVVVVLILVVAGASAVYFAMNKDEGTENNVVANNAVNNTTSVNTTSNTTQAREVPSGMKLYENSEYKFSFLYPSNLPIRANATNIKLQKGEEENNIAFVVYNPQTKEDWTLFQITFVQLLDSSKPLNQYLLERYDVSSEVTWNIEDTSYAVGNKAYAARNADSINSFGDLPGIGGLMTYFKDPTEKYFVTLGTGQESPDFLTKTYDVDNGIARDIINSIRWK